MKKVIQSVALAIVFAMPWSIKANEGWLRDGDKQTGLALGVGTAAVLGLTAFSNWRDKPTSKDLFSMANNLRKQVDKVRTDLEKISSGEDAEGALSHFKILLIDIGAITDKKSLLNTKFHRATGKFIAEGENRKRNYIEIKKSDDGKKAVMGIDLEKVISIVERIEAEANELQQKEKAAAKNRWYRRAWTYIRGQKNN